MQISDEITLRENDIVENNGSMGAETGCHDDTIMSLLQVHQPRTIYTYEVTPDVFRDDLKYIAEI